MVGHSGFVEKAMGIFMNWDAMIGTDFERGLVALKAAAEAEAARAREAAPAAPAPR